MITELYIDNQKVDLGSNEAIILLNKQFEDITNPTGYFADWSKTIKLPFSKQNNEIFDKIFRADSLVTNVTIDPCKRLPFRLLYNNQMVVRGYCKVNQVSYSLNKKAYEVNLFSTFGEIMNDLKQLTFNKNADVDNKYKIASPFNAVLNATLVKNSWNRTYHSTYINSTNPLDFMGFLASYQGCYPDFDSSVYEEPQGGSREKQSHERDEDEHYMQEYRSYYQQPYLWVDKLWQLAKRQFESFSDYKLNLSRSWFNWNNPYYSDLIYTCPSLYDTTVETQSGAINQGLGHSSYYCSDPVLYKSHVTDRSDISNSHRKILKFQGSQVNYFYNSSTGLFNGGAVHSNSGTFTLNTIWTIYAGNPDPSITSGYCKIREDNCIYMEIKAVRASNMSEIVGAKRKIQFYSCSTDCSDSGCDYTCDIGVASRSTPALVTLPEGHDKYDGYFWEGEINTTLTIKTNEPFYIVCDTYTANNSKPFEYAVAEWIPRWDWLWTDLWATSDNCASCGDTRKGMTIWLPYYSVAKYEGVTNIRSESSVDIYRVFPKDIAIFDVLLNYCKMFGLIFDLNEETKTLSIMTRDEYFENYEILDWTDKVDRSKDFMLKPISFENKYVGFNYDDGSGQRFEAYQKKYELNYGSKKLNTSYDFNNETEDLYEGLVPAMISSKKQDSWYFNTVNPDYDSFKGYGYKELTTNYFVENDDEGSSANMSGAFYFNNGTQRVSSNLTVVQGLSMSYPCVRITDDTDDQIKKNSFCWSFATPRQYSAYFPAISTFSKDNKYSVHFEAPKEYYYYRNTIGDISNTKYIYNTFWKKYIDERYNVQNKVLTAYFYLDNEDYRNYKFNKFVKIDNVLYLPNKIYDYNINGKQSTKVELVQVYDINGYLNSIDGLSYLYTDETIVTLTTNWVELDVHTSSNWHVANSYDQTFFTIYNQSGTRNENIKIRATGDNDTSYIKNGFITLMNDDGDYYNLIVQQNVSTGYLTVGRNNLSYSANGGSEQVTYTSDPMPVTCISKPSWVTVSFETRTRSIIDAPYAALDVNIEKKNSATPYLATGVKFEGEAYESNTFFARKLQTSLPTLRRFDDVTFVRERTTETYNVIVITAKSNPSTYSRTGTVTISNGQRTKNIQVYQQGGNRRIIWEDDPVPFNRREVLHLNQGANELALVSWKEVKPDTLYMTKGTKSIADLRITRGASDNQYIGDMVVTATPTDMDGTTDGGVLTIETIDGELITAAYNVGDVLAKRSVMIRADEHTKFNMQVTIGNETTNYTYDYGGYFYEDLPVGAVLDIVSVTVEDEYEWVGWSDGVSTQLRTITVGNDDIVLTMNSNEGLILYDNSDKLTMDDNSTVLLSDE